MNNTNKYIQELETKNKELEEVIANFQKEQSASIQVFKDKEKEIENLNTSLNNTEKENKKSQEKIKQTTSKIQEQAKQLKESQEKVKSLEQHLENYANETELTRERNNTLNKELNKTKERVKELVISKGELEQKHLRLENSYKKYEENFIEISNKLTAETEKNIILEEKLLEAEKQAQEGNLPSPIVQWEQEKEELLNQFEKTRNEQGKEIDKLETENNQLDKDLNKAVDLLEEKDKEIVNYKENIKKLEAKLKEQYKIIEELKKEVKNKGNDKETNKLFTCSQCQQEWSQEFLNLIDKQGNKTCSECLTEQLELTKQETGKEITIEAEPSEKEVKPELIKPCQFCAKPYKESELKPRHIKNLPNHDSKEITFICQPCLTYRAIKDKKIVYCPRLGTARDTYEGSEYDCYCKF